MNRFKLCLQDLYAGQIQWTLGDGRFGNTNSPSKLQAARHSYSQDLPEPTRFEEVGLKKLAECNTSG